MERWGGVDVTAVREDEVDRRPQEGELGRGGSARFRRTLVGRWGAAEIVEEGQREAR
jgi:hypothetical protein